MSRPGPRLIYTSCSCECPVSSGSARCRFNTHVLHVAGEDPDNNDECDSVDVARYGPCVTSTSGATAFFGAAAWLEQRYRLSSVLGECDYGVIFRYSVVKRVPSPAHH